MAGPVELRVGGQFLSTMMVWGNPVITHRRRGGCWSLSWDMDVRADWSSPYVKQGAPVEAYLGSSRIWAGFLPEFDPAEGTFEAMGLGRRYETMQALDLAGPTNDIGDAVFFASARGSGIGSVASWPTVAGDVEPRTIETLLDMWAEENPGRYWFVDRNKALWMGEDPPAPRWWVMPGSASLGKADDDYVTRWTARYFRSTTSTYETVTAASSEPVAVEKLVDLTGRGAITQAKAQEIVDGFLAKSQRRTGWTNAITVTTNELSNSGGGFVGLGMIKAGDMIRLHGFRDPRRSTSYTDAVIDESVWDVEAGEITLKPVDMADRDLASIVEAQGGVLS